MGAHGPMDVFNRGLSTLLSILQANDGPRILNHP